MKIERARTEIVPEEIPWEAESIRLTVFPAQPLTPMLVPAWQTLVGTPPAQVIERSNQGFRQEKGPLGSGTFVVTQQLQRTDIVFGPLDRQPILVEASPPEALLVRVGSLKDALALFLPIAKNWLGAVGPVGRIAYGPILIHQVQTAEEGYTELKQLLPDVNIDAGGMQDLFWQINRPRKSTVIPDLTINRLCKWNVVNVRVMEFTGGQVATAPGGTGEYATRLEQDLNTSPEYRGPIPATDLAQFFDELTGLADEIARLGDRP